jgi:hypothetical protein
MTRFLPRRLAIRLLALAQQAEDRIEGVVIAREGKPVAVQPRAGEGDEVWAHYRSHPAADWQPTAADLGNWGPPGSLQLIVSIDTKGVLQLRGWSLEGGQAVAHELKVGD